MTREERDGWVKHHRDLANWTTWLGGKRRMGQLFDKIVLRLVSPSSETKEAIIEIMEAFKKWGAPRPPMFADDFFQWLDDHQVSRAEIFNEAKAVELMRTSETQAEWDENAQVIKAAFGWDYPEWYHRAINGIHDSVAGYPVVTTHAPLSDDEIPF